MRYGWRNQWKLWKPYNRPLSEDELQYISRVVKTSPGWVDPLGERREAAPLEDEES